MSTPNLQNVFSLNITKFPLNILIPNEDNIVALQAINNSSKDERFNFKIDGENLDVLVPDEYNGEVLFGPRETKNFEIKLKPKTDGFGKLTITISGMKSVQFTAKVQKVRANVQQSEISGLLEKRTIDISEIVDNFNPINFIFKLPDDELAEFEEQIKLKRTKISRISSMTKLLQSRNVGSESAKDTKSGPPRALSSSLAGDEDKPDSMPSVVLDNIDHDLTLLAKAYLERKDIDKALVIALEVSNEDKRMDLYSNLIRAANSLDLEGGLKAIEKIKKKEKKNDLIKKLALDRVDIDPEQSGRIAFLITDSVVKDELLKDIVGKAAIKNPSIALKLSYLMDDPRIRKDILFFIAKNCLLQNKRDDITEIVRQIVDLILNSDVFNLSENDHGNQDYEDLKETLSCLAELDNPETADAIIENLNVQPLKEKLAMDLFNRLYEMVDEIQTKVELADLFSQFYSFNTLTSNITNMIKNFSLLGGNVSNNLLLKDLDFNAVFISLFSFNFSIYPTLDRVYTDLKYSSNQSIAYYIYPSINNHDEYELNDINFTLKAFFSLTDFLKTPGQKIIFNLDFIPYCGKPTVIMGLETDLIESFKNKITNSVGDSVNLFFNEDIFEGGTSFKNLEEIFPPNKCRIVNLILSYEFINDYEIFKKLVQSLL